MNENENSNEMFSLPEDSTGGLMRTFIKKDVVERVTQRSQERPDTVAKVVNDVFTVLREIMAGDDAELRIEIRDFGVFEVQENKTKTQSP